MRTLVQVRYSGMDSTYWIQEWNARGENWIDYVGLPARSVDEARKEHRDLIAFGKKHGRAFRLILRTDVEIK